MPQISVRVPHHVLEKYEDHLLLDVRMEEEREEGYVAPAVHVPIHTLLDGSFELSVNQKVHISVIYRSGYHSNIATSILKSRDYSNYSLIGGMTAWRKAFGDG